MSEMSRIYDALMAAKASNEALASWQRSMDGRDLVTGRQQVIENGIAAYSQLERQLREGRQHIEPPEDYVHTSCYCSAPTCSPPCGWCTDPANSGDEVPDAGGSSGETLKPEVKSMSTNEIPKPRMYRSKWANRWVNWMRKLYRWLEVK